MAGEEGGFVRAADWILPSQQLIEDHAEGVEVAAAVDVAGNRRCVTTEAEYEKGIDLLKRYMADLANPTSTKASFYVRADNLRQYLDLVINRLGSLSHRLSASSIQKHQYSPEGKLLTAKTPWLEVDDVFYEARGATWALLHIFSAIEVEFQPTLKGKGALATVRQIIHEFEDAQGSLLSPVILNGDGFGIFANYSLTMANYITRANAATLDMRDLLIRG